MRNSDRVRQNAQTIVDELFSSMKPLNEDRSSRENQPIHVMPDFTAFLEFP
jgi:hypothetical protein